MSSSATESIAKRESSSGGAHRIEQGVWSKDEHDKFLATLKMYPHGPWKLIAERIGTRSPRQVQTHAQKYYEKVARRVRGLRKNRKNLARPEHRIDDELATLCKKNIIDRSHAQVTPESKSQPLAACAVVTMTPPPPLASVGQTQSLRYRNEAHDHNCGNMCYKCLLLQVEASTYHRNEWARST
uniref:Uncharacterized protein n=1 Tax=Globisporangium ultimum (strain ATCC 200006 / CBS 805.95 / DAOM BR144) TaxID=431595 RepID=K3WNC5_GLOUD